MSHSMLLRSNADVLTSVCVPKHRDLVKSASQASCMFAVVALLTACASGYQAPLDDRSSALERNPPLVVVDGQSVPATPRSSASTSASSSSSTAATSSPQVGAATTVVRPVAIGGSFRRGTPDDTSPASAPQSQTQQTQSQNQASAPVLSQPAGSQPAGSGAVHVVARGDTLYSIAWAHNIDYRSLALVNNLSAPYTIYPGQRLILSESGVSEAAISALPLIPASPAGEAVVTGGQRPQAAMDARRTGSVSTRQVEGVSWQWPSDGRLLSTFSTSGASRGIDIAGMQGQPVYAAADGDVVYAGRGIQGAGNLVILRHSARHLSAYMHNNSLLVGEGDRVRAGDKIAEMGTGPSGRDMLHFEVRVDGKPVDPVRYLPNR
jgi:lipoprotein NlpD